MANLGVHVYEQATSLSTPVVADAGIPYVVGVAPSHAASKPGKAYTPVLCTSWAEAVEKLGFSYDWETYTLCEFMYSHFQLFGCQPVLFCNVFDPAAMQKTGEGKDYAVSEHRISIPFGFIHDEKLIVTCVKKTGSDEAVTTDDLLVEDEDYSVLYDADENACIIELLPSGDYYQTAELLHVEGQVVEFGQIDEKDIIRGLGVIDECMTVVGVIPDLVCAPGYSHLSTVAAVMATKAAGINGLFRGKALIDIDSGPDGCTEYSSLTWHKNKNNFIDENQVVCWPMVKLGDYRFHLSTQLAGLMAKVDTENAGCPYESPSNKALKIDGCCLADGTEVNLTWEQVQLIAGSYGIVTALNFMSMGWVAKGNYVGCYPANTDVKDYFIPVSRMFDWVGNTLIRTFWSKLDKPMTRRLVDSILDTCNLWLAGLVSAERLLGARAEMLAEENPLLDLMAGILRIHIYITPPSPAQEIDFTLEYDPDYVQAALSE